MSLVGTCLTRWERILRSSAEFYTPIHFRQTCPMQIIVSPSVSRSLSKTHTKRVRHDFTTIPVCISQLPFCSAEPPSRAGQEWGVALHLAFVFFWIEIIFGFFSTCLKKPREALSDKSTIHSVRPIWSNRESSFRLYLWNRKGGCQRNLNYKPHEMNSLNFLHAGMFLCLFFIYIILYFIFIYACGTTPTVLNCFLSQKRFIWANNFDL